MGDMAEMAVEAEDCSWFNHEELDLTVWETKEHERIKITDMKTSHILNCIRMIERNCVWRFCFLEPLKNELKRRSEVVKI